MAGLLDLANRLESKVEEIGKIGNNHAIRMAATILRELTEVTPVDTSEAVSNWQISLGEPPVAKLKPYFLGKKGSTRGASSQMAYSVGIAELKTKLPGQSVFISNLAPYIRKLNYEGTSAQAAPGFVERAILLARKTSKSNVVLI